MDIPVKLHDLLEVIIWKSGGTKADTAPLWGFFLFQCWSVWNMLLNECFYKVGMTDENTKHTRRQYSTSRMNSCHKDRISYIGYRMRFFNVTHETKLLSWSVVTPTKDSLSRRCTFSRICITISKILSFTRAFCFWSPKSKKDSSRLWIEKQSVCDKHSFATYSFTYNKEVASSVRQRESINRESSYDID